MKLYSLYKKQTLPISIEQAWEFFSNPKNLELITPPSLNLKPVSDVPDRMYPGMIVLYRVKPFAGIGVNWVTEITHVNEPHYFVDEQRFGPYKFWHHQHHFRPVENGTLAEDLVHYALPFEPVGRLANGLVVRRQLEAIFEYRSRILSERLKVLV